MASGSALPLLALGGLVVLGVAMSSKSSASTPAPVQGGGVAPGPHSVPLPGPHPSSPGTVTIPQVVVPGQVLPGQGQVPLGPTNWPFDVGMPADIATAVTTALAMETDPKKLRAYAASLRPDYPIAATALELKAAALEAAAGPSGPLQALPQTVSLPSGEVVQVTTAPPQQQPAGFPAPGSAGVVVLQDPSSWLNLRAEPNAGGEVVATLPHGTRVTIIGPAVNGFIPVEAAGSVQGYASANFIGPAGGGAPMQPQVPAGPFQNASTSSSDFPAPGSSGVVTTNDPNGTLNLRDAPNTGGNIVAQLPNGAAVQVIGPAVNGFLPVQTPAGTVQGYASAQYLAPAPTGYTAGYASGAGSSYGAIADGHKAIVSPGRGQLVLRSAPSPSAPEVARVGRGVAVLVDGPEIGGYYPIRYAGGRAYASGRWLVPAPASASTAGAVGGPTDALHGAAVTLNGALRRGVCTSANEPMVRDFQSLARGAGLYPGPITGFYDTVTQAALAKLVGAPAPPCFPERGGPMNPNTYWQG